MIIAIEGIDGSGKGTQTALLQAALRAQGRAVSSMSFPQYTATKHGRLVGKYLNGDYGDLHPQMAALLFAGDRREYRDEVRNTRNCADIVIIDRYVDSNVAHQCARLTDPQERAELKAFIYWLEYYLNNMPRPNLTITLDLPVPQAVTLIAQKAKRTYTEKQADLHEADEPYLERVRQIYFELAASPDCNIPNLCVPVYASYATGAEILPREDVARSVLGHVQDYINAL